MIKQAQDSAAAIFLLSPEVPASVLLLLQIVDERQQEAQRRGNKATQTSDAKFDATFKFAHTLGGTSAQVALQFVQLNCLFKCEGWCPVKLAKTFVTSCCGTGQHQSKAGLSSCREHTVTSTVWHAALVLQAQPALG